MPSPDAHVDVVRRLLELQRIPLFAELPPSVLIGLAEHAREQRLLPDRRLASGLPANLHLFPTGADCGGANDTESQSFVAYMPELVPWLAGAEFHASMRARGHAPALAIPTAQLALALEDEFGLYLAVARALARKVLAARPSDLTPGVGVVGELALPREDLNLFDRVLLLRAMLPFAHTHVGALVQLARHAAELRANAGHELWREGDAPDSALFVVDGAVRARATGQDDVILGPGYVLGGFDALARAPRWFTAVADGPLTALVMPAERFFDVLEDQHELARDLLRDLARAVLRAWSVP